MWRAVEHAAQPFDRARRIKLVGRIRGADAVEFEGRRPEEEQGKQHGEHHKRPGRVVAEVCARLRRAGCQLRPLWCVSLGG